MNVKNKIALLLIIILFATSCVPLMKTNWENFITPIPESEKKLDIPKYPNGKPYAYWHFCKLKQQQLNLSSLENSTDSLILRIWLTDPEGKKNQAHELFEIKYDSGVWKGQLILMKVNFNVNNLTETITQNKAFKLTPKTKWDSIIDSLFKLKIDILPTDDAIPDYYNQQNFYNNNAVTISIEYSTKKIYRFYQYSNVYRVKDKFWQPRNVIDVFSLFQSEFNYQKIAQDYFGWNS